MSHVGRQNSNRWANAAVPSYGDDWDDNDYDDDDDEYEQQRPVFLPLPTKPETIQEGEGEDELDKVTKDLGISISKPSSEIANVGLSKLESHQSAHSSHQDHTESAPVKDSPSSSHSSQNNVDNIHSTLSQLSKQTLQPEPTITSIAQEISNSAPPRPAPLNFKRLGSSNSIRRPPVGPEPIDTLSRTSTLSKIPHVSEFGDRSNNSFHDFVPETPRSEFSFTSDADSIQNEPEKLNIKAFNTGNDLNKKEIQEEVLPSSFIPKEHVIPQSRIASDASEIEIEKSIQPDNDELIDPPDVTRALTYVAPPLVLSIDKRNFVNDVDGDSDDDEWGYNGKSSDDEENEEDDLENMINELKNSDILLPNLNPLPILSFSPNSPKDETTDLKLDTSSSYYGTADPTPTTPLALRSPEELKRDHDEFVNRSRRGSVRKAPTSAASDVPLFSTTFEPSALREEWNTEKDSSDDEIDQSPNYKNEYDTGDVYLDSSNQNSELNIDNERGGGITLEKPLGIYPVDSSGLLSTGNLTIDARKGITDEVSMSETNNDFLYQAPTPIAGTFDEVDRRASTMTTGTFSMGNWKPNTNSFRDKFINDNDNDNASNYNFKENNELQEFGELRSNRLSLSIPETLDAALPRIPEDLDRSSDGILLHSQPTNTTSDGSLFKPPAGPRESMFKEDINSLTQSIPAKPVSSMLDVLSNEELLTSKSNTHSRGPLTGSNSTVKGQDSIDFLSSKISHNESNNLEEGSRVVSADSGSQQQPNTSLPSIETKSGYPPYSWNKIMSTLQSIDRIRMLNEAKALEENYDTGLQNWLQETLKLAEVTTTMHIGKIATAAYQNATHTEIKRHNTLLNKVSKAKDKVESSGSSLGKKLFSRIKKLT